MKTSDVTTVPRIKLPEGAITFISLFHIVIVMALAEVAYAILLNGAPIWLLLPPVLVGRKKLWGKVLTRVYLGLVAYYVVYLTLPSMFQYQAGASELAENGSTAATGASYVLWRNLSAIFLYLQYPFYLLPTIFVLSPFVALLFLRARLRKEEGTTKEKLAELVFEVTESPKDFLKRELMEESSWSEEKELLKLFVVLLPISLYLLSVILDVTTKIYGVDVDFLSQSSPLGWFLEIFFVYLATFLTGIHLLYRSRVSFKGRFVGEDVRENVFGSLATVGAPISILSIVLFVVNYTESILVVLYFFAYFLMAAVIFVMLLKVFLPLSILLFVKVVDWWKNAKKSLGGVDWNSGLVAMVAGIVASLVVFLWVSGIGTLVFSVSPWETSEQFQASLSPEASVTLADAAVLELIIVLDALVTIGGVLIMALIGYASNRGRRRPGETTTFFVLVLYAFSVATYALTLLSGSQQTEFPLRLVTEQLWVSTTPAWTDALGFRLFTMRTVFFTTEFTDPVLFVLAAPYSLAMHACAVVLWMLAVHYWRKDFLFETLSQEGLVQRIAFSSFPGVPTWTEVRANPRTLALNRVVTRVVGPREGAEWSALERATWEAVERPTTFAELFERLGGDQRKVYDAARENIRRGYLRVWTPEFSHSFREAKLNTLHVIYSDGRDIFSHKFPGATMETDPALVAGMFSAITSFVRETTRSSDLLRTIDHGDVKLIIEYGRWVFAAVFADRETTDVRDRLRRFVQEFEAKHSGVLDGWNGQMDPFDDAPALVEQFFY
ncbi:MAG: hypothetical protein Kow0069_22220 [Promethearchaeota archaeon]